MLPCRSLHALHPPRSRLPLLLAVPCLPAWSVRRLSACPGAEQRHTGGPMVESWRGRSARCFQHRNATAKPLTWPVPLVSACHLPPATLRHGMQIAGRVEPHG